MEGIDHSGHEVSTSSLNETQSTLPDHSPLFPNSASNSVEHIANASTPTVKTLSELISMHTLLSTAHISDRSCTICQEDYTQGPSAEFALKLPDCGHIFGVTCISNWLSGEHNNCPMCRKPILDIDTPLRESVLDDQSEGDFDDDLDDMDEIMSEWVPDEVEDEANDSDDEDTSQAFGGDAGTASGAVGAHYEYSGNYAQEETRRRDALLPHHRTHKAFGRFLNYLGI